MDLDDCRRKGLINYYGAKVDFGQGKQIIKKAFAMKKKVLEKYLRDFV